VARQSSAKASTAVRIRSEPRNVTQSKKPPVGGFFYEKPLLDTDDLYLPMRMTISGLPRHFDKFDLQRLFNPYGWVDYTKIIIDPLSGLSKGKGIVEMKQDDQAKQAMAALQGKVLGANPLNIKETKEGGFKPW
jgi:RNA recognition motif-containing protein